MHCCLDLIQAQSSLDQVACVKAGGAIEHQGKRGGLRLIYYWDKPNETIYMLFIYRKSERENLTPDQIRFLRRLIMEYLE